MAAMTRGKRICKQYHTVLRRPRLLPSEDPCQKHINKLVHETEYWPISIENRKANISNTAKTATIQSGFYAEKRTCYSKTLLKGRNKVVIHATDKCSQYKVPPITLQISKEIKFFGGIIAILFTENESSVSANTPICLSDSIL
jgi:hemin uptake protein HemP